MPLGRLVPPLQHRSDAQIAALATHTFLPLDVHGDRQYLLSLRHGELRDRGLLFDLLRGRDIQPGDTPGTR